MNNFADQEMPLTSGIAIKQEIKEEFHEDNSMACDDLGVKKESKDEEDYFDGAEQVEMKFEAENESLLDISIKSEETNKEILSEKVPKEKGNEKNPLSKDRLFECDICPKKYKTRDGLNEHTKFVHKKHELDQFKCRICNYATVRKSNFIKHLKIHDSKNYLKCKFCHYTTAWLYNLNTHVTRKHNLQNTGENKVEITGIEKNPIFKDDFFCCKICPKKYKTNDGLLQHTKFVHKKHELDQFKCSICDYETVRKNHFIKHLKIHEKKNYFECHFRHYMAAKLTT